MKKTFLNLLFFMFALTVVGQQVSVVNVYSQAMQKEIANTVVLPENYSKEKTYPVVYLLHGYSGKHGDWANHIKKTLPQEVSRYDLIIVCPDGNNSWYWDSPVDPTMRYDTYVTDGNLLIVFYHECVGD